MRYDGARVSLDRHAIYIVSTTRFNIPTVEAQPPQPTTSRRQKMAAHGSTSRTAKHRV
jgi:hypothetical protein